MGPKNWFFENDSHLGVFSKKALVKIGGFRKNALSSKELRKFLNSWETKTFLLWSDPVQSWAIL